MKVFNIGLVYFILSLSSYSVLAQNTPALLTSFTKIICASKTDTIDCTGQSAPSNNQTVFVYKAEHGVQTQPPTQPGICNYSSTDCLQTATVSCTGTSTQKCSLFSSTLLLNKCQNKKSDYLLVNYYCIPLSFQPNTNVFDVCAGSSDITANYGFIQSPNYPKYQTQATRCVRKIVVPPSKTLNIYVTDINIKFRDLISKECGDDYLQIIDSSDSKTLCGKEKEIYTDNFCSNEIFISYKSASGPPILGSYSGFRIYFEIRDAIGCTQNTQTFPIETTRPMITTTSKPVTTVVDASRYYEYTLCKSRPAFSLIALPNTLLFFEDVKYGAPDSGQCETYNSKHCTEPYPVSCNLQKSCSFVLNTDVKICNGKIAQYIFINYRFIPTDSSRRFFISDNGDINGDSNPTGVLFSRNFPTYEPNLNQKRRLVSTSNGKAFKIYVTDIGLDDKDPSADECKRSYVEFSDGKVSERFCSSIVDGEYYAFESCSNTVDITYVASSNAQPDFRGFRTYFELIDLPSRCVQTTVGVLTTRNPAVTTANPNQPTVSSVLTTNGNGQKCVFPFKFNNMEYNTCINTGDNDYWCSLSYDYDNDKRKAYCSKGLSSTESFIGCKGTFKNFTCPQGYVINILSADAGVTSDLSCDASKATCIGSIYSSLQLLCAGLNNCRYYVSALLPSCSNANANYASISYNCIPSSVPMIKVNDVCTQTQLTDATGIVQSPSFPNTQSNRDCTTNFNGPENKLISFYSIETSLENPLTGQDCKDSYIRINDGEFICGIRKTQLLTQTCSSSFKLNLKINTRAYKGFKLFYEVSNIADQTICQVVTTESTLSSQFTTVTIAPDYVNQGIASNLLQVNVCDFKNAKIDCPDTYIIAIRRTFYGRSSQNKCYYSDGDCINEREITSFNCAGKQSCTFPYSLITLSGCSSFALSNYIQVEYDCIPNTLTKQSMCNSQVFTGKNGLLANPNFPIYDKNLNCTAQIVVNEDSIVKAYITDMSINPDCNVDQLTFTDSSATSVVSPYCGPSKTILAFESCDNKLEIKLRTQLPSDDSWKGVSIYYEAIKKPSDLSCSATNIPTTPQPFSTLSTSTRGGDRPTYFGFASPLQKVVDCNDRKITCPANYIISVLTADYGVSNQEQNKCGFTAGDCSGPFLFGSLCSGLNSCAISFKPNLNRVPNCQERKADYYIIEYKCIPIKDAGSPTIANIEFCNAQPAQYDIATKSSAIIQSPSFGSYPTQSYFCKFNITTGSNYALNAFLNSASFPTKCNDNKDYVKVYDNIEERVLCGASVSSKFLFQSQFNWITVEFSAKPTLAPASLYKGFQLYFEPIATLPPFTGTPRTTTNGVPINLGFASPEYSDFFCAGEVQTITCPADYIIIITEEYLVSTNNNGCRMGNNDCRMPTSILTQDCAGKQSCKAFFSILEMTGCGSETVFADLLDYKYQCVPSNPIFGINQFSCGQTPIKGVQNGIITSPAYPIYLPGQICTLTLSPPENTAIKIYLIDIALSSFDTECSQDYLAVAGDKFCSVDNAKLIYQSKDWADIMINYKSIKSDVSNLRGFKLYFEANYIPQNTTSGPISTKTQITNQIYVTQIEKSNKSTHLTNWSLGLGIPVLILLVVAILFVNKMGSGNGNTQMRISYSPKKNENQINDDITSFSNPNLDNSLYDNSNLNR